MTRAQNRRLVSSIMTRSVTTLGSDQSVQDARYLMAARQFRNVPVIDENDRFMGILTHRRVLREALRVNGIYGPQRLDERLAAIELRGFVDEDCARLAGDTPVVDAARLMLEKSLVSAVVLEQERVVGMLAVADFLKLVIELLDKAPDA